MTSDQRPQGRDRASLPADHAAEVIGGDEQLDDRDAAVLGLGHLHGVGNVDQRPRDHLDDVARLAHWAPACGASATAASGLLVT